MYIVYIHYTLKVHTYSSFSVNQIRYLNKNCLWLFIRGGSLMLCVACDREEGERCMRHSSWYLFWMDDDVRMRMSGK